MKTPNETTRNSQQTWDNNPNVNQNPQQGFYNPRTEVTDEDEWRRLTGQEPLNGSSSSKSSSGTGSKSFFESYASSPSRTPSASTGSSSGVAENLINTMAYITLIIHVIIGIICICLDEEVVWIGIIVILLALPVFAFYRTFANISITLNSINDKLYRMEKRK